MVEEKDTSKEEKTSSEEKEVTVPKKFKNLVEEIEKMSVIDLAELVELLEKKFNVSAQAPVATMVSGGGAEAGESKEEEKSSYDVELTEAGDNKIGVIKAIREFTQIGLKDAKDLVDAAPKVIKEGVDKEEAENMKKKMEEAGAKVNLK
jgi:large subunit ribosomal protein L7/L12